MTDLRAFTAAVRGTLLGLALWAALAAVVRALVTVSGMGCIPSYVRRCP